MLFILVIIISIIIFYLSSRFTKYIGIIGAMDSEIDMLRKHSTILQTIHISNIQFYLAKIHHQNIIFAKSGVGTVFSSMTSSIMLTRFPISHIIFTGVAGGLQKHIQIGDIVFASDTINYDMDVTAFSNNDYQYKIGEIPFIKWRIYKSNPHLLHIAKKIYPKAHVGRIATGSKFLNNSQKKKLKKLWNTIGNPLACEMEMAGVAQVCKSFNVPFLGIRSISDSIYGDANTDFNTFAIQSSIKLWPILKKIILYL